MDRCSFAEWYLRPPQATLKMWMEWVGESNDDMIYTTPRKRILQWVVIIPPPITLHSAMDTLETFKNRFICAYIYYLLAIM